MPATMYFNSIQTFRTLHPIFCCSMNAFYVKFHHFEGVPCQEAADKALANMAERVKGYGGVIVLSNTGDAVTSFTTERMSWAWAKEGTLHSGVNPGEDIQEQVNLEQN